MSSVSLKSLCVGRELQVCIRFGLGLSSLSQLTDVHLHFTHPFHIIHFTSSSRPAAEPGHSPDDVSGAVLLGAADDQLLGPVHVLGGEPVAAAGELCADVEPRAGRPVGRRLRTLGVAGVEARPPLVAARDARLRSPGASGQVTGSRDCSRVRPQPHTAVG